MKEESARCMGEMREIERDEGNEMREKSARGREMNRRCDRYKVEMWE